MIRTKTILAVIFLALVGAALAAPTEERAKQAFTLMMNRGDFDPKVITTDPSAVTAKLRHWVKSASWETPYVETYAGRTWTVFVVNAVFAVGPSTSEAHRFKVRAGIALTETEGRVSTREAFKHVFSPAPPPTPEEVREDLLNQIREMGANACRGLYESRKAKWGLSSQFVDAWLQLPQTTDEAQSYAFHKKNSWGEPEQKQFESAYWDAYDQIVKSAEFQNAILRASSK